MPSSDKPLFILGAGVDKCLGFPLMNDLMFELRKFKYGDGKGIHEELRKHVKGLHFDFDKYAGEKGTAMGSALLGGDGSTLDKVKKLVNDPKITASPQAEALRIVVSKLERIREGNDVTDDDRKVFAKAEGSSADITVDHLIDPANIRFSDIPRKVLRDALKQAIQEEGGGKSELYGLLLSLSNFEELLGEFFTGFFTKDATLQKRYFYLAWLFWAYIRVCEASRPTYENSFYELLDEIGDFDLITFNYTRYSQMVSKGRAKYFHGNNEVVLDFDTRLLDSAPATLTGTVDLAKYISKLTCEFGPTPAVKVPGLVPPLIMKPILASEYLDWWYEAAQLIANAKTIVIVGYSFAFADEHFNDLIRKRATKARLIAIDPFWDGVCANLCRVTATSPTYNESIIYGVSARSCGRLAFYNQYADKLDITTLKSILDV